MAVVTLGAAGFLLPLGGEEVGPVGIGRGARPRTRTNVELGQGLGGGGATGATVRKGSRSDQREQDGAGEERDLEAPDHKKGAAHGLSSIALTSRSLPRRTRVTVTGLVSVGTTTTAPPARKWPRGLPVTP